MKEPRELAARALCKKAGLPENTKFEGRPMWQSYLVEVDTVLDAANVASTLKEIAILRETLKWVRAHYAARSSKEVDARIEAALAFDGATEAGK